MLKEEIFNFGSYNNLVGIATIPENFSCNKTPAVIILNAGIIHRVGPNGIYVKLARAVSELGFFAFRFDFSGIGDSVSIPTKDNFNECAMNDTLSAIQLLTMSKYKLQHFILVGLCSGGDISFQVASLNSKVVGVVSINSFNINRNFILPALEQINDSIVDRYRKKQLFNIKKWLIILERNQLEKLFLILRKKILNKFTILMSNKTLKTWNNGINVETALSAYGEFQKRGVKVIQVYSEGSNSWDAYNLLFKLHIEKYLSGENLCIKMINDVDHTFTPLHSHTNLINIILSWVQNNFVTEKKT